MNEYIILGIGLGSSIIIFSISFCFIKKSKKKISSPPPQKPTPRLRRDNHINLPDPIVDMEKLRL